MVFLKTIFHCGQFFGQYYGQFFRRIRHIQMSGNVPLYLRNNKGSTSISNKQALITF